MAIKAAGDEVRVLARLIIGGVRTTAKDAIRLLSPGPPRYSDDATNDCTRMRSRRRRIAVAAAVFFIVVFALLEVQLWSLPVGPARATPSAAQSVSNLPPSSNSDSSLTLLYQNNLDERDDANHIGAILLDPLPYSKAAEACAALNESLLSSDAIETHSSDFSKALAYVAYQSHSSEAQFWIEAGIATVKDGSLSTSDSVTLHRDSLRPLCTQSDTKNSPEKAVATDANEIRVLSNGTMFVGFRNQKSFRFLGLRYADPMERWKHSTMYMPGPRMINAKQYGTKCPQGGMDEPEDCLFLNIQTPYLPKAGSRVGLRPVLFYIHGGAFLMGSGSESQVDGGNLASREDVVTVTINYRLATLGFFTIPGTNVTGNYGIGDQITALDWVRENIASFGGDLDRITIAGDSAGAGSCRALLGSPKAIGKFQGAILMSNLGGDEYSESYSRYMTAEQSYAAAGGKEIFKDAGCNQWTLAKKIACLRRVDSATIATLPRNARYVTIDGTIVTTPHLNVVNKNGSTACVHTMWGVTADEGASIGTGYPKTPVTNEADGIMASLGVNSSFANAIIDSGLFPLYDTGNITLDSFNVSQRVATDRGFRCIDEATVYAATVSGAFKESYYWQFEREEGGFDPSGLGGAFANDVSLPYFRYHSGDEPWLFGTPIWVRDDSDLKSLELTVSYFTSFVKTGNPNADAEYLTVRGYDTVLQSRRETGEWEPVRGKEGPIRFLDWPSTTQPFQDVEQCAWLGFPLDYYLKGGM